MAVTDILDRWEKDCNQGLFIFCIFLVVRWVLWGGGVGGVVGWGGGGGGCVKLHEIGLLDLCRNLSVCVCVWVCVWVWAWADRRSSVACWSRRRRGLCAGFRRQVCHGGIQ